MDPKKQSNGLHCIRDLHGGGNSDGARRSIEWLVFNDFLHWNRWDPRVSISSGYHTNYWKFGIKFGIDTRHMDLLLWKFNYEIL
jgi:hypothetical protein